MKLTAVILVCLLVCGPAYGREHKHAVRTAGALRSAVTAAKESDDSDATDSDDSDTDTDDQPKNDDSDDVDTNDTDTGETADTDDHDDKDTNKNDDDTDNDDADGNTTSAKAAIRNLLKASALKHSEKPLARLAAALNTGLSAKQTLAQLLEPAGSGSSAAASAKTIESASGALAAIAADNLPAASNAVAVGSSGAGGQSLSIAAVPEPATLFLLAMGVLPWSWHRRRS